MSKIKKILIIPVILSTVYMIPFSNLSASLTNESEIALIRGVPRVERVNPIRANDRIEDREHREDEYIEGENRYYVPVVPERRIENREE